MLFKIMSWTLLDRSMGSMVGESLREVWNVREPEVGWNGERESGGLVRDHVCPAWCRKC